MKASTGFYTYKSWVRPVLEYAPATIARAGPTAKSYLIREETKALRIAMRAPPRTSSELLYRTAGLQPFAERLDTLRDRAIARYGNSKTIVEMKAVVEIINA